MLVTGRYEPIVGADLIEASLERLDKAVDYVHTTALEGFNDGVDVWTLMHEIQLPPELRVGQGYGKVSWAVRTFWEEYVGWFKLQSTTELYPDPAPAALAELVDAVGVDATLDRAEAALDRGDAVVAIRLGEAVEAAAPDDPRLRPADGRRPPVPLRQRRRDQLLGGRLAPHPGRALGSRRELRPWPTT